MTPDYRHARDIPDTVFLQAILKADRYLSDGSLGWATRWDIESVLGGGPVERDFNQDFPGVPPKLVLAKANRLINRGLITGCTCGCRGDFELTDKGRQLLEETP